MAQTPIMGRPVERDREVLALELIEWAKLDDSINLNGFCVTRVPPLAPQKVTLFAEENENFREAYNFAKSAIAERRELRLNTGTLHVKAYDLNASVYDHFIRGERTREAKEKNKLAIELATEIEKVKSQNGSVPPEIQSKVEELFSTISAHQSARKMACKSNNTESKSVCETGESSTCRGSES